MAVSSAIECGWVWFPIQNKSSVIQSQKMLNGRDDKREVRESVLGAVRARAKIVCGRTMVLMSDLVKRYSVLRVKRVELSSVWACWYLRHFS